MRRRRKERSEGETTKIKWRRESLEDQGRRAVGRKEGGAQKKRGNAKEGRRSWGWACRQVRVFFAGWSVSVRDPAAPLGRCWLIVRRAPVIATTLPETPQTPARVPFSLKDASPPLYRAACSSLGQRIVFSFTSLFFGLTLAATHNLTSAPHSPCRRGITSLCQGEVLEQRQRQRGVRGIQWYTVLPPCVFTWDEAPRYTLVLCCT